jgi:hypothetical protein
MTGAWNIKHFNPFTGGQRIPLSENGWKRSVTSLQKLCLLNKVVKRLARLLQCPKTTNPEDLLPIHVIGQSFTYNCVLLNEVASLSYISAL